MPLTPEAIAEMSYRLNACPGMALRYLRPAIPLPDGRQIVGQAPGVAGVTLPWHELRDKLARLLHGITGAALPFGRADVLTMSGSIRGLRAISAGATVPARSWCSQARLSAPITSR